MHESILFVGTRHLLYCLPPVYFVIDIWQYHCFSPSPLVLPFNVQFWYWYIAQYRVKVKRVGPGYKGMSLVRGQRQRSPCFSARYMEDSWPLHDIAIIATIVWCMAYTREVRWGVVCCALVVQ